MKTFFGGFLGLLVFLAYIGNGLLFLYIYWTIIRENFVSIFLPITYLEIFIELITTPLFWIFTGIGLISFWGAKELSNEKEN